MDPVWVIGIESAEVEKGAVPMASLAATVGGGDLEDYAYGEL